jgi:hypothetical protein
MGALPSGIFFPSLRAYHFIDVLWLFGTFRELVGVGTEIPKPQQYELDAEKWLQKTWTDFAADPMNALTKLGWKQYDPEGMWFLTWIFLFNTDDVFPHVANTLAELFVNNSAKIDYNVLGKKYDDGCPEFGGVPILG